MNSNIKVLIIDSGVKHPAFKNDTYMEIQDSELAEISKENVQYGHGTAVYGIIRKNCNIADIYILHVKNIEKGIEEEALIRILAYIDNYRIKFDVINLSLGISCCNNYETLKSVCDSIVKKGTIIVSAFSNDGTLSYPAAFKNVIGVVAGELCNATTDFEVFEDEVVNIAAKGGIQRLAWLEPAYIFLGGNSFACAHVTNKVIQLMHNGITDLHEILASIKKDARYVHYQANHTKNIMHVPFTIKKAALFPFNKEMHSLIRFSDLLDFEIESVYDSKYSIYRGASTDHILQDVKVKKEIKNISDIDWDAVDTIILGHMNELINISNTNIREDIISQAIAHGKNVYSFDKYDSNYKHIFYPKVYDEQKVSFRYGMMYKINKPVFSICGTSSAQGKNTLQLKLREKFLNSGYDIGEIGTEPTGLLFGMDYVVPMGYNSTVTLHGNDLIMYINQLINHLCIQEKEIIMIGTQAGSVNYEEGNLSRYNVDAYSFLLGANPDCIVLCINPYDPLDYISRTINFLEASVNTKVIGLVVFPMTLRDSYLGIYGSKIPLTDELFHEVREKLKELQLPVYRLDIDEDIERLYYSIIHYFV